MPKTKDEDMIAFSHGEIDVNSIHHLSSAVNKHLSSFVEGLICRRLHAVIYKLIALRSVI